MGWWPFGRKRKKTQSAESKPIPPPSNTRQATTTSRSVPLQNSGPANPFSDSNRISSAPPAQQINEKSVAAAAPLYFQSATHPALRQSPKIQSSPHLRPVADSDLNRSSSVRSLKLSKESGTGLLSRKSSKARRADTVREEQLQAASHPMPIPKRASQEFGTLNRSDSKRPRNQQLQNRASTISPPVPLSVRSSMTSLSDHTRFNVGGFDILNPHPTLRYSFHDQYKSESQLSRTPSRPERRPMSRRTLKESKTIDELADDLDASTLRELMERDQRRREKRRKADNERVRWRLERYGAGGEEESRPRDALQHLEVKQGPYRTPAPAERPAEAGPSKPFALPEPEGFGVTGRAAEDPFADPESAAIALPPEPAPSTDRVRPITPFEDPVLSTAHTIRYSQASLSPPSSPRHHARNVSSISNVPDVLSGGVQDSIEPVDASRRGSEPNRRSGPLAALFRRSVPGIKGSEAAPSEGSFSNTSRESMARQLPPSHLRDRPLTPKVPATPPVRTKSKFREDLPELPLSPPDSRLQSPAIPEAEEIPPLPSSPTRKVDVGESPESRTDSYDSAAAVNTSATVLSQSLASVDSEASWLSGKPNVTSKRGSIGRLSITNRAGAPRTSHEELSTSEDSYLRRSVSEHHAGRNDLAGIRAALAADDDDSDQGEPGAVEHDEQIVHGEVVRKNTIIHRGSRVKSAEGLLNQWGSERPETPPPWRQGFETPSEDSPGGLAETPADTPYIEKAHARHLSVGSARLLDIPARSDSQRSSVAIVSPMPSPLR